MGIIGVVFGFIYILVWIGIMIKIVSVIKKTNVSGSGFSMNRHNAQASYIPDSSEALPAGPGHMHIQTDEPKGFFMSPDSRVSAMEDRQHDWLATQIAEERKFNKLDLGAAHDFGCAAEEVASISRSLSSAAESLSRLGSRKR